MIYADKTILYATMHGKDKTARRLFSRFTGADLIIPKGFDTDRLGTFSGEISRPGLPEETAKQKCQMGMAHAGLAIGLASEGSFGPHPYMPFVAAGREILYFQDDEEGFSLQETRISPRTNYAHDNIDDLPALERFLKRCGFPRHAVILKGADGSLHKGLQDYDETVEIFSTLQKQAAEDGVHIETDMRAHLNPTRRKNLIILSAQLVRRLLQTCPACDCPGWGIVGHEPGLPCESCHQPTQQPKAQIFGCARCGHEVPEAVAAESADPRYCSYCNP